LGSPSLKGYTVLEGAERWIGKNRKKAEERWAKGVRRDKRKGA